MASFVAIAAFASVRQAFDPLTLLQDKGTQVTALRPAQARTPGLEVATLAMS